MFITSHVLGNEDRIFSRYIKRITTVSIIMPSHHAQVKMKRSGSENMLHILLTNDAMRERAYDEDSTKVKKEKRMRWHRLHITLNVIGHITQGRVGSDMIEGNWRFGCMRYIWPWKPELDKCAGGRIRACTNIAWLKKEGQDVMRQCWANCVKERL